MSTREKLLKRFLSAPNDFTCSELRALLLGFGFQVIEGKGSRVKFFHPTLQQSIHCHKPHPDKLVRLYALKEIQCFLRKEGLL